MSHRTFTTLYFVLVFAVRAETITFSNFRNVTVPPGICTTCVYTNAEGDLAGNFTGSGFEQLAGTGLVTPIMYPGAGYTRVYGLNDAGSVVGYYVLGTVGSFNYSNGSYASIPLGQPAIATGINNHNDIVGYYSPNNSSVGFIDINGNVTSAGFPDGGNEGTYPTGINDAGASVGYYYGPGNDTGGSHGFIRNPDGSSTSFDFSPTAPYTSATAINNNGIIAGDYGVAATNSTHIFVRFDGSNYPYDPAGALYSYALSMTNNGELFGVYGVANSGPQYFLVDVSVVPTGPVPEPATWLTSGLAVAVAARLRRRYRSRRKSKSPRSLG